MRNKSRDDLRRDYSVVLALAGVMVIGAVAFLLWRLTLLEMTAILAASLGLSICRVMREEIERLNKNMRRDTPMATRAVAPEGETANGQ